MLTTLLYLILPLFGLIVPFSIFSLIPNSICAGLIYGHIIADKFTKNKVAFLILVSIVYSTLYLIRWQNSLIYLAIAVFVLSLVFSLSFLNKKGVFVGAFISILIVGLVLTARNEGADIMHEVSHDPGREYTTDMRAFLKSYYLIKDGESYFRAFVKGVQGAEGTGLDLDIGGWREPFIFYVWKALPGNGSSIYVLITIFFSIDLLASYLIAKHFLPAKLAVLSPFILYPYFHYPLIDLTFMQMEWWAMSFFLVGLAIYFSSKQRCAGIFFALALTTRELFIIPIATILLFELLQKHYKTTLLIFLPVLLFLSYYFVYYIPNLWPYGTTLLREPHVGDWHLVNRALAYSSWSYLLGIYRSNRILLIATTLSTLYLFLKRINVPSRIKLGLSYIPFFIVILWAAGTGRMTQWNDYWGIYIFPVIMTVAPAVILQIGAGKPLLPLKR